MQNFLMYYILWFSNLALFYSYSFLDEKFYLSILSKSGCPYILQHGYGNFFKDFV